MTRQQQKDDLEAAGELYKELLERAWAFDTIEMMNVAQPMTDYRRYLIGKL